MRIAEPSDRLDTVRWAYGRKFRTRVLLGILLLLLILNGVGISVWLKAFVSTQRLRVALVNRTERSIRGGQVEHDGHVVILGAVDPYGQVDCLVPTTGTRKVRITCDVRRGEGRPDDHVESEVSYLWEPGDLIEFEYYGDRMSQSLNHKLDISGGGSFKIQPGKRP